MSIKLSSKNQIVIPKNVRQAMELSGGDVLEIQEITKDYVVLKKAPAAKDLIGIVPKAKSDPVNRTRKIRDNWR